MNHTKYAKDNAMEKIQKRPNAFNVWKWKQYSNKVIPFSNSSKTLFYCYISYCVVSLPFFVHPHKKLGFWSAKQKLADIPAMHYIRTDSKKCWGIFFF